jgi:hypothetical protein
MIPTSLKKHNSCRGNPAVKQVKSGANALALHALARIIHRPLRSREAFGVRPVYWRFRIVITR